MSFIVLWSALSTFGGVLLYLAARRANYLRISVGWTALAIIVFQIDFLIVFLNRSVTFYMDTISAPNYIYAAVISTLILLCMIALCVFSVLMLVRLFKKKRPSITE